MTAPNNQSLLFQKLGHCERDFGSLGRPLALSFLLAILASFALTSLSYHLVPP